MYNLRYHIASLVAVFLALAMGLLLGSIVVERGVLSSQQSTLVAGLQQRFDQVSAESATVQKANDTLSAFSAEAAPRVAAGALEGTTVLVIAAPDSGETVANVTAAVRAAGGHTAVATFSDVGLSLADKDVAAAAAKALGVAAEAVDSTAVITALAREWGTPGDPRVLTKALSTAAALKLTGLPATATVDAVAVTAAFGGKPDPGAFALAKAITGTVRPALGVESTKHLDGTAVAAKAAGLSGVDDIDTPIGGVSLVWVLAGRTHGLFGVGDTVDSAYPSPLFPVQP